MVLEQPRWRRWHDLSIVILNKVKGLVTGGVNAPPQILRRCGWLSMTFSYPSPMPVATDTTKDENRFASACDTNSSIFVPMMFQERGGTHHQSLINGRPWAVGGGRGRRDIIARLGVENLARVKT